MRSPKILISRRVEDENTELTYLYYDFELNDFRILEVQRAGKEVLERILNIPEFVASADQSAKEKLIAFIATTFR